MPPKEIRETFMRILGKESPSYSTVIKWAAEFQRGRESFEDDGRCVRPKDRTTDDNVKVVHPGCFGAVQSILTDIMCGSRGGTGGTDPPEKSQKYRAS